MAIRLKSSHQDPQRVELVSNRNSWIVVVAAFVVAGLVVVAVVVQVVGNAVVVVGAVALEPVIETVEEVPSFPKSRYERRQVEDWHRNPTRSLQIQVPREALQRYPTLDRQPQQQQPKMPILPRTIYGS